MGPHQGRHQKKKGGLEERGTEESEGPGSRLMVIQREHQKQEESSPDRVPLVGQK